MNLKCLWFVLLVSCSCLLALAESGTRQVSPLDQFVNSNERFGRKLLKIIQESDPGKNVAVSPLPVSLSFAPLSDTSATVSAASIDEIRKAFEWTNVSRLELSARMLLSRFDDENMSVSSAFYFRGADEISERFVYRGRKYFGLEFKAYPPDTPEREFLPQIPNLTISPPKAHPANNDFWIVSSTHLRTVWAGNTFSLGTRKMDSFVVPSGQQEQVSMIESESSGYLHARTRDFEAIVLRCFDAYLLVVMPAPDKNVSELASELASDGLSPDEQLRWEIGQVELPEFSFQFESDLRPALEKLGIRRVFSDAGTLSAMATRGAVLRGVAQNTDIEVNREGIRANSVTVTNGVYGGVCGNCTEPFHMIVNRPFIFLIRDEHTNALLFVGSVTDPAAHRN
jgi:serine protease inhibitor